MSENGETRPQPKVDSSPVVFKKPIPKNNNNSSNNKNNNKPMSLSDLYEKQQQAERQVMNRLLFSQRIGKFINTLAIVFIGTGLLLNLLGYDFVMRDGQLGIDTLEARQFLNEVQRTTTSTAP